VKAPILKKVINNSQYDLIIFTSEKSKMKKQIAKLRKIFANLLFYKKPHRWKNETPCDRI
jgi:hypothetical protein